jgi:hypothetical protein
VTAAVATVEHPFQALLHCPVAHTRARQSGEQQAAFVARLLGVTGMQPGDTLTLHVTAGRIVTGCVTGQRGDGPTYTAAMLAAALTAVRADVLRVQSAGHGHVRWRLDTTGQFVLERLDVRLRPDKDHTVAAFTATAVGLSRTLQGAYGVMPLMTRLTDERGVDTLQLLVITNTAA